MKGTIIGTDLLEKGDSVKILEINTNTTIYNTGAVLLDYDPFFNVLTQNNITELHFIWTEGDAYQPIGHSFKFEDILKEKCEELGISYTSYKVPQNSVTVPYIEDSENKFILRQSFDTTAIVDELYCADKFQFFDLMKDTEYIPKTYYTSPELSMDTLNVADYSNGDHPNLIKKYRYPDYNLNDLPSIYSILDDNQLNDMKNEVSIEQNILMQEFIYDTNNIVDGRYNIIRSIDILYGPNLDVINMGGYNQSTLIPLSFSDNEFVEGTRKLNQKTRYKYITKELSTAKSFDYHVDDDTNILNYDGTLKNVNTIQLGDYVKSISFTDFNGNDAADPQEDILEVYGWDSTLQQSNDTLTELQTTLSGITSANVDTLYIRITLENGASWTDAPSCTYYIEELNSTETRFEKVNMLYIGDKLIVMDKETNELTTLAITGLEMEYAVKTIYQLDFEPSDLFLVDVGEGLFGVMHNSCWCSWNWCGYYCWDNSCPGCGGGSTKIVAW